MNDIQIDAIIKNCIYESTSHLDNNGPVTKEDLQQVLLRCLSKLSRELKE